MRIALDDFGTGYASLTHLKQFPVDVIKIDRSFVQHILTSPDDRAIVRTMVCLGTNMSIEIVAERIEHADQAELLRLLRCDTGQGFLYGKALPAGEIPALMQSAQSGTTTWHGSAPTARSRRPDIHPFQPSS